MYPVLVTGVPTVLAKYKLDSFFHCCCLRLFALNVVRTVHAFEIVVNVNMMSIYLIEKNFE